MKKFFTSILILILIFSVGCSAEKNSEKISAEKSEEVEMKIKISVGEKIFYATLENNPTTQELMKKLPLEVEMTELNGNEKYFKFAESFPTDDKKIGEIHTGDLMLFGSNYLVVFTKIFRRITVIRGLEKLKIPKTCPKLWEVITFESSLKNNFSGGRSVC